jgi:MFS family permease
MHPILVWQGLDPKTAAGIFFFFAIATACATFVAGILLDRIWAPLVGTLFTLCPVIGCFLLMGDHISVQTASVAVALVGVAMGAEIDIIGYLTSRYFGVTQFGAIYGLITLFIGTFNALGGMSFGFAFEHFHGYREALGGAAICYLVSAAAYLFLGRYPKPEAANSTAVPAAAE